VSKLTNKICLITGGSGVLCSAISKALGQAGGRIVLLGRTMSKLEQTAQELVHQGLEEPLCVKGDVTNQQSLEQALMVVEKHWGAPDVLVNGAGGNNADATAAVEELTESTDPMQGFFGMDPQAFAQILDLNFLGTLRPCMVFGKKMVEHKRGCIINISSMSAQLPLTKVGGYSAAKAAVDNFTRWLAVHFAKTGVRVNALAPGFFVSEQNRFLLFEKDGKTPSARGGKIIAATPMGRFGKAEELGGAMVFLASDDAAFVTGVVVPVDGGFSAYSGV